MTRLRSAPGSSRRRCARAERSGSTALAEAARPLAPELARPSAVRRVEAALAVLPPDLSDNLIFECRLGPAAGRLDVSLKLEAEGAGALRLATGGEGIPPWAPVRALLARWIAADPALPPIDTVWLELDLPPGRPAPELPGVFFGSVVPGPAPEEAPDRMAPRLASAIDLLRPGTGTAAVARRLGAVLEALPAGARLFQTGILLGRDDPRIRLCIEGLSAAAARRFLAHADRRSGAPERTAEAFRVAAGAGDLALSVDVEVDGGLGPRVGLELYAAAAGAHRLEPLLLRLEERRLCTPGQRRRLLGYRERGIGTGGDEEHRIVVVRDVSHLKLVAAPGRPLRAKAYLAIKRRRVPRGLLVPPWASGPPEPSPGRTRR